MATEILIVWPEATEAGQLHDKLLRTRLGILPRIVDFYPDRPNLQAIAADPGDIKAIVVGMSSRERALQVLRDIRHDCPSILAVAAHTSESPALLRAVMRTGTTDFLVSPFHTADLIRCFESVGAQDNAGPIGNLIALTPCQGTDGASTIAVHLAQGLSQSDAGAALLVDCDVQCGVAAFRLGLSPKYTLADALSNVDRLDDFLAKIVVRWGKLDFIAAPDSPLGLMGDHMERLPQALAVARRRYPAVVADLPPGPYAAGLQVLLQADEVYLVCTPEITSLHLARRRISEFLGSGVGKDRLRVLLNRAGSRNAVSEREIERVIGLPVHNTLPNDYDAATAAAVAGSLIGSDSRLGRDIRALAEELSGEGIPNTQCPTSGWRRILSFG